MMLNYHTLKTLDHFQIRSYTPFGILIRMMLKCHTNHNAPIYTDDNMRKWVIDIRYPRSVIYSIENYERHLNNMGAQYIVVRPNVVTPMESFNSIQIAEWRRRAAKYWASLEGKKYAIRDIYVLFRRLFLVLLDKISIIDPDAAKVYCTEGTDNGYKLGGWQPAKLGHIELKTPRLYEQATKSGEFICVDGSKELYNKIMNNEDMINAHPRRAPVIAEIR